MASTTSRPLPVQEVAQEGISVEDVDVLCRDHYDLATSYARRIWRSNLSLQDRIDVGEAESAGGFGLLRAAQTWNPSAGPFNQWLRRHVRYEIWEAARQANLVSRAGVAKLKELREAEVALEKELGRPATVDEVAECLGITETEVGALHELRNSAREAQDLETAVPHREAADTSNASSELVESAMAAFGPLSGDERVILTLHYMEGVSFRDVARILNKRPDAVSRMHTRAKSVASRHIGQILSEGQSG